MWAGGPDLIVAFLIKTPVGTLPLIAKRSLLHCHQTADPPRRDILFPSPVIFVPTTQHKKYWASLHITGLAFFACPRLATRRPSNLSSLVSESFLRTALFFSGAFPTFASRRIDWAVFNEFPVFERERNIAYENCHSW
jgi:hypothetical protein